MSNPFWRRHMATLLNQRTPAMAAPNEVPRRIVPIKEKPVAEASLDNDLVPREYKCMTCPATDGGNDRTARIAGWDIGAGNADPQQFCPECASRRRVAMNDIEAVHQGADSGGFAIGDVVQLNSGGLEMTIAAIIIGAGNGQSAQVFWSSGDTMNNGEFPIECLRAVRSSDLTHDPEEPTAEELAGGP